MVYGARYMEKSLSLKTDLYSFISMEKTKAAKLNTCTTVNLCSFLDLSFFYQLAPELTVALQWNLSWETAALRDHLSWKTGYSWQKDL